MIDQEFIDAGVEALDYQPYCLCHELTAKEAVEIIGAAVLRAASARLGAWGEEGQLRLAEDEHGTPLLRSPFFMWEDADRAAGLIDPDKATAR